MPLILDKGKLIIGRKSITIMFVGIIVFILILAVVFRPETLTWDRAILAALIAFVGMAPFFIYLMTPIEKRFRFPFMPLVGLYYATFFGLIAFAGSYLRGNPWLESNSIGLINFYGSAYLREINIQAQILTLVGISLMFLCWGLVKKYLVFRIKRFSISGNFLGWRRALLIWGLIFSNLVFVHFSVIRSLPSVGQFLEPAGYIGFSLMIILYYRKALTRLQYFCYFFVAFPFWILGLITLTFFTPLIFIILIWVGIRFYFTEKMSLGWLFCFIAFIIIAYPMMNSYRYFVWKPYVKQDVVEKLKLMDDALELYSESKDHSFYVKSTAIIKRVGLIFSFSHVVNLTPKTIPYWKGLTYRPIFTGWVPRVFWQDKPREDIGNKFGRRYLISAQTDFKTSINLPWLTEMFVNFGNLGVILGMCFVGLFLGVLECVFNKPEVSDLEFGVGTGLLIPLCFPGSNFTLMTGSILPLVLCLWIYFSVGMRLKFGNP